MKPILIRSIKHEDHRKEAGDTVGDWYEKDGNIIIEVSEMSNNKYELLVAVHELIEKILCDARGVTEKEVNDFDFVWEGNGEAGDDIVAPYYKEHRVASIVERLLAHELNVNWGVYDDEVTSL